MKYSMNIYDKLCSIAGEANVLQDEPMSRHTTFRTGGPAEYLVSPDMDSLPGVIMFCREQAIPLTVIGNGSNLLVGDKWIPGVVVEIGRMIGEITLKDRKITAQAGALLSAVSAKAAADGLTGLEFASGIPGSVGGAVIMNAGAYGGEIKDTLIAATVLTKDGQIVRLPAEDLELSYRHSNLPEKESVVLEAEFVLEEGDVDEIAEVLADLKQKRTSKQPLEYPSAGSTFKRPEGHFAGKLIEDAGLKGYTIGGAQVSEKHCGFVINKGGATSADVLELIRYIQKTVEEQFGVSLETEVRLLGTF